MALPESGDWSGPIMPTRFVPTIWFRQVSVGTWQDRVPHVHTYRAWLDETGAPVGVQQKLMRHAHVSTTMD